MLVDLQELSLAYLHYLGHKPVLEKIAKAPKRSSFGIAEKFCYELSHKQDDLCRRTLAVVKYFETLSFLDVNHPQRRKAYIECAEVVYEFFSAEEKFNVLKNDMLSEFDRQFIEIVGPKKDKDLLNKFDKDFVLQMGAK
jgi:hypothetical protein